VIFLDLEDLLHVARRTLADVEVRDVGLLESASARPRSMAFGEDAYPSIHAKAAALRHSIARNHPLVDGNKRLALAATIAFYGLNGFRLTATNDEAYELVMAVAAGELDDVEGIANLLESSTAPRS
jgi:death-on-curing protein